jgi:hypothetical protein
MEWLIGGGVILILLIVILTGWLLYGKAKGDKGESEADLDWLKGAADVQRKKDSAGAGPLELDPAEQSKRLRALRSRKRRTVS